MTCIASGEYCFTLRAWVFLSSLERVNLLLCLSEYGTCNLRDGAVGEVEDISIAIASLGELFHPVVAR